MFEGLVNRAFKNKKGKYEYDFEVDEGEYQIKIYYLVSRSFFLQAVSSMQRKIKEQFNVLESFEVPTKLFGMLGKNAKNAVKQITEQVKKDKPAFKTLSWEIVDAAFQRQGGKYCLTVTITGVCMGA